MSIAAQELIENLCEHRGFGASRLAGEIANSHV